MIVTILHNEGEHCTDTDTSFLNYSEMSQPLHRVIKPPHKEIQLNHLYIYGKILHH